MLAKIFDIGVFYGVVAGVCAIVMLIILNRVTNTRYKETIDKRFCNLVRFFIIFCCIDCVWGFFNSQKVLINYFGMTLFTYGFHSFAALSAFMWSDYLLNYIDIDIKKYPIVYYFRYILLTTQLVILLLNLKYHVLFDIDPITTVYKPYILRNVMFYVQFTYYYVLLVFIIYRLIKGVNDSQKQNYRSAAIFAVVILIFGYGQMYLPDACMYSLGFLISAITIYSFNITSKTEQYLKQIYQKQSRRNAELIAGLSEDIRFVYYVDLDTGHYSSLDSGDDQSEEHNSNKDFFTTVGKSLEEFVHESDRHHIEHFLSKNVILKELKDKNVYSFGFRNKIGNNYKYYRLKVVRPEGELIEGNKVLIGIYDEDETVRKRLAYENEIKEAAQKAKKASEAKTEFLFNMSHDIRTPMNAIIGFTDMAKRHFSNSETVKKCLDKITTASDHLLSLINDVLDMSRIESGKLVLETDAYNIRTKNDGVVEMLKELANKKDIEFSCEYKNLKNEYLVYDSLRFNQIVMNIVSNAIKYTLDGGKVDYIFEQVPSDNEEYAALRLTVSDNGIGMSDEFLKTIYDKFNRASSATKSGVEGTGLGMAIVKQIVDMMGGTIDIQSKLNKGTTVVINLKFLIAENHEDAEEKVFITKKLEGKRILLVEDNELNREISRDILEEMGIIVDETTDGSYAVEIIRSKGSSYYDAILMDVQMPIMNGYEATKIIRALLSNDEKHLPIIATTANAFTEDKKNALDAGMDGHVSKPVRAEELARALMKFIK